MKQKDTTEQPDEQALVKLYMDLTGASEASARSVLIYVDSPQEEPSTDTKLTQLS